MVPLPWGRGLGVGRGWWYHSRELPRSVEASGVWMGEEQKPELSAWKPCQESVARVYLSQDKKSVLGELLFETFSQNLDENTKPLSRDQCTEHTHFWPWHGQSNHRRWPSLGAMQFWGSGLHYFPNYLSQTLSFPSLCSFLLLPLEEGLGYECRAALPCVGYGGPAGMAQPQLAARRNSGAPRSSWGKGRYSVISVTSSPQRLSLRVLFLFLTLWMDC